MWCSVICICLQAASRIIIYFHSCGSEFEVAAVIPKLLVLSSARCYVYLVFLELFQQLGEWCWNCLSGSGTFAIVLDFLELSCSHALAVKFSVVLMSL